MHKGAVPSKKYSSEHTISSRTTQLSLYHPIFLNTMLEPYIQCRISNYHAVENTTVVDTVVLLMGSQTVSEVDLSAAYASGLGGNILKMTKLPNGTKLLTEKH